MLDNSRNIRRLKRLIIAIVAILLMVIFLFPVFVSKQKLTDTNPNNNHTTQNILQKPIILGEDSQGRQYKISAQELLQQTANIAILKQIDGYITNNDNSIIKFITQHAKYDNSQQILYITSKTILEWVDRYNLAADKLEIKLQTKDINAEKILISDDGNYLISADNMAINGSNQAITLSGNVNIKIKDINLLSF